MANDVQTFINQIAPLIVAEGKRRGYKVFSTTIAQAIIESKYGKSLLGYKYHNYFGLKAGKVWLQQGKPAVSLKTKEEYTVGKLTTISDYFRSYNSMAEGVAGYYDFISSKRYENLRSAVSYEQFALLLKADGYATSSSYVSTLCNTVIKYALTKYDSATSEAAASPYSVGQTYTTNTDLNIRSAPNGAKVKYDNITENAKLHAKKEFITGNAILCAGTRVTCQVLSEDKGTMWMKIPSGWICAYNTKKVYIQ